MRKDLEYTIQLPSFLCSVLVPIFRGNRNCFDLGPRVLPHCNSVHLLFGNWSLRSASYYNICGLLPDQHKCNGHVFDHDGWPSRSRSGKQLGWNYPEHQLRSYILWLRKSAVSYYYIILSITKWSIREEESR